MNTKAKQEKRYRRRKRVRAKICGTKDCPRFSVFRSHQHIWCQLIDDEEKKTIVTASDKEITGDRRQATNDKRRARSKESPVASRKSKVGLAFEVGKIIAKKAKEKGIEKVIFDRGGYKYHGRVKTLAEGARDGGLKF